MAIKRYYQNLPFSWQSKSPETIQTDCEWLESIILNAAPFSDWWVKARIVQLAYPNPPDTAPSASADALPTYAGLTSEAAIAEAVRSLCDLQQYPGLAAAVDENFVTNTLNSWKTKQFTQAISRNFEVYADRHHPNVFLVTSTATVSLHVERSLPPQRRFRALFNVNEFADIVQQSGGRSITLRSHGYATAAQRFYKLFMAEADELNKTAPVHENAQPGAIATDRFYIGYHWPSEQPIFSPGLWVDFRYNPGIVLKFLFVMFGLASIFGALLYLGLKLLVIPLLKALGMFPAIARIGEWSNFRHAVEFSVEWYWIIPCVFILWVLLMQVLRIVAYQRDRNRAIHYGAPDLAEFFWRLDKALNNIYKSSSLGSETVENFVQFIKSFEKDREPPQLPNPSSLIIRVNLIGHSMGALLVVNALRSLSDRFGKDDQGTLLPDWIALPNNGEQELVARYSPPAEADRIGEYLLLDKLILIAPDIPLEFMREGRNNYVRSAMRRCRQIYLMSSDRDLVLRYMSTLGNWFSEPSLEMSGLRLGNVYLRSTSTSDDIPYHPFIRNMFRSQPAAKSTSACDLFQKFNYIDCSEMEGVNGINLPLSPLTALAIDIVNAILLILGKIDDHGGYFLTKTTSFAILKLLIKLDDSNETIRAEAEISRLISDTKLRFLPSQPFLTTKNDPQPSSIIE